MISAGSSFSENNLAFRRKRVDKNESTKDTLIDRTKEQHRLPSYCGTLRVSNLIENKANQECNEYILDQLYDHHSLLSSLFLDSSLKKYPKLFEPRNRNLFHIT